MPTSTSQPVDSDSAADESSLPGTRGHILIVEDDADLADLFRDWIQRFYGDDVTIHVVKAVADAETKLASLPALSIAIIDWKLPDGDGEDVLSAVRSQFDAIAVVVTAVSPDSDLIGLPTDDYLVKPVDEETLLKQFSLLEKLDAAGVLQDYTRARKASLLEYHLENPERDPLFRRFTDQWSYDRLEIAHVEDQQLVYGLYIGDQNIDYQLYTPGTAGQESSMVSVSIVGELGPDLKGLLADGEIAPVGELAPTEDGYTWINAKGTELIDTASGSIGIYEFTCEIPEQYLSDADADASTGISHRELKDILEEQYN